MEHYYTRGLCYPKKFKTQEDIAEKKDNIVRWPEHLKWFGGKSKPDIDNCRFETVKDEYFKNIDKFKEKELLRFLVHYLNLPEQRITKGVLAGRLRVKDARWIVQNGVEAVMVKGVIVLKFQNTGGKMQVESLWEDNMKDFTITKDNGTTHRMICSDFFDVKGLKIPDNIYFHDSFKEVVC